jgi:hypothetical protein
LPSFTTFYNALLSLDTSPLQVLYSPDVVKQLGSEGTREAADV